LQGVHNLSDLINAETAPYAGYNRVFGAWFADDEKKVFSIMYTQTTLDAHTYIAWKYRSSPDLFASRFSKAELGIMALWPTLEGYSSAEPLSVLNWVLKENILGVNDPIFNEWIDDKKTELFSHDVTLWLWFLVGSFIYTPSGGALYSVERNPNWRNTFGQAMRLFLEHDADPVFSLELTVDPSVDFINDESIKGGTEVTLAIVHGHDRCKDSISLHQWHSSWYRSKPGLRLDSEFLKVISGRGGKLELQDIVDVINPENAEELKEFVNERLESQDIKESARRGSKQAENAEGQTESALDAPHQSSLHSGIPQDGLIVTASGGPAKARSNCPTSRPREWLEGNPWALIIAGEFQYSLSFSLRESSASSFD
jgi:hypothetical protein